MAGLRGNVEVALRYLAAWLAGNGAVGIHGLMEDAATAEISRSQVWQWVHAGVELDTGETVTDGAGPPGRRRGGRRDRGAGEPGRRPPAVRAGGARRRVPRLPDAAGLRADRLMLGEEIYEELDRRLTQDRRPPADAGIRGSGRSGSRCTPATCPRTPSSPGWRQAWGAAALAALDEHGLPDLGLDPAHARRGPAPACGTSWPPSRSRTCGSTPRTATAAPRTPRTTTCCARPRSWRPTVPAGTAPPSVGIRGKSLEGSTRHRGVRSLDLFLAASGRWPGRGHAAQGHRRRAGAGVPVRPRRARGRARGGRRPGAPDRDPAGGARARTAPPRSPGWCTSPAPG